MRGPRQELLEDGSLGPAGAALLYRAVHSVALARNFPPPEGHDVWDQAAVQSVAHEFLSGPRGSKRLADILARSDDEAGFDALLHAAVLNAHRDRGRATDFGALVLRVTEVLTDSDAFRRDATDPGRWTRASGPDRPSAAQPAQLERAAAGVRDVTVPRWTSATRRAPAADRITFERILQAVLTAADGSVTAADCARACQHRLHGARVPLTVELDVLEFLVPSDDAPTEEAALNQIVARQLFDELSDRERAVLATFDLPVRAAAAQIGLGHSQAAVARTRLVDHLQTELAGDPDGEEIFAALRTLADEALRVRTRGQDATL